MNYPDPEGTGYRPTRLNIIMFSDAEHRGMLNTKP